MEREFVRLHAGLGVKAERVPLSGAMQYRQNGADVDIYVFGPDSAPLVCEVKARASGEGFATLERWLGDADGLFLRRDRADPLAVLPWRTWTRLIARIAGDARHAHRAALGAALPELHSATPTGEDGNTRPSLLPAVRAVVTDDGAELRVTLYDPTGPLGSAVIDASRALKLARQLVEAAALRIGPGITRA